MAVSTRASAVLLGAAAVIDAHARKVASATPAPTRAPRPRSKSNDKLELMEQARRAGWRGTTYHSAKKFERKLDRVLKQHAARDRVAQ